MYCEMDEGTGPESREFQHPPSLERPCELSHGESRGTGVMMSRVMESFPEEVRAAGEFAE